jgi:hypothetical protein
VQDMVEAKENTDGQKMAQTETKAAEAKKKADGKYWKAMQKMSTAGNNLNTDDRKSIF